MFKTIIGFFHAKRKFSLLFIFAVTGLLALAMGLVFSPIKEDVSFSSSHSIELNADEILRFQFNLANQGTSRVWIDMCKVNSRLSWLQILELGKDDNLTPFTGTGLQPTSWHELKPGSTVLLNVELAGCGVTTDKKYVISFTIRDWRGKEKIVFGRVKHEGNKSCSITRHYPRGRR